MSKKKHILVIDDEAKLCRLIKRRLELSGGYEVTVASSGGEGIDLAGHQELDLVITDVKMPGITGAQVIKTLKAKKPKLPIVLFSIYHDDISVVTPELRNMVDGLVAKPIDHDQLQKTIETALSLKSSNESSVSDSS